MAGNEIRVAHVGPDPATGGGMPSVIRGLLASPLAEQFRLEAVPTYRTAEPLARVALFAQALMRLVRWCIGPGARLVHVHATVRGSLYRKGVVVALAKLLGRRVILHLHSGPGDIGTFVDRLGPGRRRLFRRMFALADRVLSVSSASAEEWRRRLRTGASIIVVPNAAPPPRAVAVSETPASDHVEVVYLGGFENPVKGGNVLVRALPAMLASPASMRVTMAGPGEPPPAARELLEQSPRLHWAGWLDEDRKAQLFARCDVFLLPSTSEGLPVAVLEAMAWGRAIVATRVGGVPEILTDGVDAMLVSPGDVDALQEAVSTLAADPEARLRLGDAALERARRLNDHEVRGRLDALYRELAAE